MSRLLLHPLLSLGLAVMWLLLNTPPGPATVCLALLVGWLAPFVMRALHPDTVHVRAPQVILVLALRVFYDVVRSNLDVAKVILGLRRGTRHTGFVSIPLDLRSPYGLTVLSIIVTGTPGTLWIQYDSRTGRLLLHVLDLVDGEDWVRRIKDRYERPLMEIFP